MASLSRQLAQWVVGLRYEDLPAEVIDRAKGVTLHSLTSVLLSSQTPSGQQAVRLITTEEAGCTIAPASWCTARGDESGAAFAAEMVFAGGSGAPHAHPPWPSIVRVPSSRRKPQKPPAGTSSPV
jgi:hypothetical protein